MVRGPALSGRAARPAPWLGPLVFLAAALAFVPGLRDGFVWDDWALIDRTMGFRGLDWRHLHWMFTTTHMANYTPLAWLSYALDYAAWGLNPVGYHLTNLLIHALNAAAFFVVARLILARAFFNEKSSNAADAANIELGAAFAALAFALHPLRVESVAWASERRDVLAGFFCLATVYGYLRAADEDGKARARWRLASIAAFAAAALSKPTVVPLPAALIALDCFPLKRFEVRRWSKENGAALLEKWPYVLLSLFSAAMAVRAQVASENLTTIAEHGLFSRLAQAFSGAGFYLAKTILPLGLSSLYPLPETLGGFARPLLLSAAALAAVALALKAFRAGREAAAALWIYYLAMILPVLGLVQNGHQFVALRYSYLSCLGWAVLAGAGIVRLLSLRREKAAAAGAALAAACLWLAANAWTAQAQLSLWRDDKTLWSDVIRQYRGNGGGFLAFAETMAGQGRFAEAQAALETGLAEHPDQEDADALLGFVLFRQGRDQDALPHLLRAAKLKAESAEAQGNAGAALARLGRFAEALPFFENASRLAPGNPAYAAQLEHVRGDLAASRAAGR